MKSNDIFVIVMFIFAVIGFITVGVLLMHGFELLTGYTAHYFYFVYVFVCVVIVDSLIWHFARLTRRGFFYPRTA